MRPATLSQAIDRITNGEAREMALASFLDAFYGAAAMDRLAMLADEPQMTGDDRLDCLAAAIAEYLARQYRLARVPGWVATPQRCLKDPWFTGASDDPGLKSYLAWASPAEFRNHNIFTDTQPLQRARTATAARGP